MAKRIATTALTLAVLTIAVAWVYREDARGDLCPTASPGCTKNITLPCPDGKCISNSDYLCTIAPFTSAAFVTGTITMNPWVDCKPNLNGTMACERTPTLCVTLTLFRSQTDCGNGTNSCGTHDDNECTKKKIVPCN